MISAEATLFREEDMEDMKQDMMWMVWIILGIFGPVGLITGVEIVRFFLGKSNWVTFLICLMAFVICLFFLAGAWAVTYKLDRVM
jgi:hypothetical protein